MSPCVSWIGENHQTLALVFCHMDRQTVLEEGERVKVIPLVGGYLVPSPPQIINAFGASEYYTHAK